MERTNQDPRWAHGEAVSMGLVFACSMAENRGLLRSRSLKKYRLCWSRRVCPFESRTLPRRIGLLDRIEQDKKSRGGRVSWILPERPGSMLIRELSREEVREHLTDWIQKG